MGHQVTLPRDCAGKELEAALLELADQLAARVRAKGYVGRTVMLTLRDPNLMFLSRMKTLPGATDLGVEIFNGAMDLLKKHWSPEWPVRMVGLALGNLTMANAEQLSFFINREKIRSMEKTCDAIRSRFGDKAIFRAASMVGGVNHVL
jgi:DNA polymerase-4